MAILSVATFISQPGNKAAEAANQAKQYQAFRLHIKSMPLTEAQEEYAKIQAGDSAVLGALCNAAEFGELVRLGASPPFKLSIREKCLAWFAGDLPRQITDTSQPSQ